MNVADSYTELTVRGIASEDDVRAIENELQEIRGVQMVTVDRESGHVEVRRGEELVSGEQIESTVQEAGYEVE